MIRRLGALVLAAILLAGNVAAVDCAGWQPSASDRMACCMTAEHECPDQWAADQCCAAGESSQQPTLTSAVAPIPAPAVAPATLPPFVLVASILPIVWSFSDHPQSPPHFRRTVLLI